MTFRSQCQDYLVWLVEPATENHIWEICSNFGLITVSAWPLGESLKRKKNIHKVICPLQPGSSVATDTQAGRAEEPRLWLWISGRQAWCGASTFPVVQLITVFALLIERFSFAKWQYIEKSHLKIKANGIKHKYTLRARWLPVTQVFWSVLHTGVCYWLT